MKRRAVLGGGLAAALGAAPALNDGAEAAQRDTDATGAATERVVSALGRIEGEIRLQRLGCVDVLCAELETIRKNQRIFVRAQNKFPDYIDVSLDVWEKVYDWLILTRQNSDVVRLADGRLGLPFYLTTVVLRPELNGPYVSLGYDAR
jgi:hypothetical protein